MPLPTWKRCFDLAVAGGVLVLLAPLLGLLAVAVRLESPGPVLFRQVRTGRHSAPFVILKFRTMGAGAPERQADLLHVNEADPPLFKIERDPRATRLGAVLRSTHLDELPQFLNVLRGEMSVVGPRPLPPHEAAQVATAVPQRHDVRPGVTGPWQVGGGTALSTSELCELDRNYVETFSFRSDCRLVLATLRYLTRSPGAAARAATGRPERPPGRPAVRGGRQTQLGTDPCRAAGPGEGAAAPRRPVGTPAADDVAAAVAEAREAVRPGIAVRVAVPMSEAALRRPMPVPARRAPATWSPPPTPP